MKGTDQNGFASTQVLEEKPQPIAAGSLPPSANGNMPFVPSKDKPKSILKENGRLVFVGAGIVLVLLLLAFNGISRHSVAARKDPTTETPHSSEDR